MIRGDIEKRNKLDPRRQGVETLSFVEKFKLQQLLHVID